MNSQITLDTPTLNYPATRAQALEIIRRWPHLRRTTGGGELSDTISQWINRKHEQKDCDA